jgi:hypothetical protein
MNLRLLLFNQADKFVVLLDRLERFDIHRLPGRTGSMHHTRHAPLQLAPHRDDKSIPPDRDQVVLSGAFA